MVSEIFRIFKINYIQYKHPQLVFHAFNSMKYPLYHFFAHLYLNYKSFQILRTIKFLVIQIPYENAM